METSSCIINIVIFLFGIFSLFLIFYYPPNFSRMFSKLRNLEFKGALLDTPFIPVTVPVMAVLALAITLSLNKEVKINDVTLITYKQCKSKKVDTKVATIKIPGCIVASL